MSTIWSTTIATLRVPRVETTTVSSSSSRKPPPPSSWSSSPAANRLPIRERGAASLRGGWNSRSLQVDGLTGVTLGAGVEFHGLSVDYAFLPYGDLGSTHRVGLSAKF